GAPRCRNSRSTFHVMAKTGGCRPGCQRLAPPARWSGHSSPLLRQVVFCRLHGPQSVMVRGHAREPQADADGVVDLLWRRPCINGDTGVTQRVLLQGRLDGDDDQFLDLLAEGPLRRLLERSLAEQVEGLEGVRVVTLQRGNTDGLLAHRVGEVLADLLTSLLP